MGRSKTAGCSRSLHLAHVGSNAGATGVHRSVELNMQFVIARLFREPHLQFTWIGDGLLRRHKFFASLIRRHARAPTRVLRL
jgi:hypothetical protein